MGGMASSSRASCSRLAGGHGGCRGPRLVVVWGWSSGAAELAVYIVNVRECERAGLVWLGMFVGETVLPCIYSRTTRRRRVLEALGEAGGLCTARTVSIGGGVIVCTLAVGPLRPG